MNNGSITLQTQRTVIDSVLKTSGRVLADVKREWQRERELFAAERKALVMETQQQVRDTVAELKVLALEIEQAVERKVAERLAVIKDGAPGPQGPQGEKGEKGEQGEQGEKGEIGAEGPQGKTGPQGPPGETGPQGAQGATGEKGAEGPQGRDGRDGLPGVNGRDGAPGEPGINGRDGVDGFSLEDFQLTTPDEGRTWVLSFQRGDTKKLCELKTAIVLDRGIHKDGTSYQKGDGVTRQGCFWICQVSHTKEKPGYGAKDWRLAVKEGRPGKDGKDGEKGDRGPEGRPGRDLTNMTLAGEKY